MPHAANKILGRDDLDRFSGSRHGEHHRGLATFDASDGNKENCEQAQALFQAQPGVKTKFWCEKGRFKK
jgi:hypothetical protein